MPPNAESELRDRRKTGVAAGAASGSGNGGPAVSSGIGGVRRGGREEKRKNAKEYQTGRAIEGTSIDAAYRPKEIPAPGPLWDGPEGKVVLGIRGNWYDVTNFVDRHPGGDIIKEFHGQDATVPFLAMHDEAKVLKHRRPCGSYEWDPAAPSGLADNGEWIRLHDEFKAEGLFEKDMPWYYWKVVLTFSFLAYALTLVWASVASGAAGLPWVSRVTFALAALMLSEFWHQCGFFMHDMMHRHIFDDLGTNHYWAWLFANVGMGVSRKWWRDDHIEHHVFPNTVISGVGPADPQAAEEIWAQNPKLFQFFNRRVLWLLVRIQHIIFVPALIFVGPIALKVDSFVHERRWKETVGILLHIAYNVALVQAFEGFWTKVLFYYTASCLFGVLEFQLLVGHYYRPFSEKDHLIETEAPHARGWFTHQLDVTTDINTWSWFRWYYGGLDWHSVHHVFPLMSRAQYHRARPRLLASAEKLGLPVHNDTFFGCVKNTIRNLRHMKTLFSMDPR